MMQYHLMMARPMMENSEQRTQCEIRKVHFAWCVFLHRYGIAWGDHAACKVRKMVEKPLSIGDLPPSTESIPLHAVLA